MTIENSHNFRRVSDLVTTSGVVGPDRLKSLGLEGYAVVINLLPDESKYAAESEREITEKQGVKYVYIPVDFESPTLADYDQFVLAIEEAKGGKVHIHCAANYRASAFYALYAESRELWSRNEAEAFIQDLWQPQERPPWPEFIAEVRERDSSV